jgi:3-dehydroquinate dehydratase type I
MRRLLNDKVWPRVCIPIVETGALEGLKAIEEANPLADLIELRMDYLKRIDLVRLAQRARKPLIVTNRRKEEGGKFLGGEPKRVEILEQAIDLDVAYIDIEARTDRSLVKRLLRNKKRTQVILSFHDLQKTSSPKELKRLCNRMHELGADILKVVTFARSWEDNLITLSLIPYAKREGYEIVTFCMGEKGRMSRIFAPMLGIAWTYASLRNNRASAPGQLNVLEIRRIWENLR